MNTPRPRDCRPETTGIYLPCLSEDKVPGKPYCVYEPKEKYKGKPTPRNIDERQQRIKLSQPEGFPKHYKSAEAAKKGIKMMKSYGSGWRPPTVGDKNIDDRTSFTDIVLSTSNTIPGIRIIDCLGLVTGNTVRSKHVGRDIMAGVKSIFGGELKGYTEMMKEAREEALDRMVDEAVELGANAIINIRFTTSSITEGASELLAYGTAVIVE